MPALRVSEPIRAARGLLFDYGGTLVEEVALHCTGIWRSKSCSVADSTGGLPLYLSVTRRLAFMSTLPV